MKQARIMVGYRSGEESRDALVLGAELAAELGAGLTLAAGFPELRALGDHEAEAVTLGRKSDLVFARAHGVLRSRWSRLAVDQRAAGGDSAAEILRELALAEQADLVVLGSAHRGRLGRILLGSVGDRLIRIAPCPVAIAPRGYAEWPSREVVTVGAAYDGTDVAARAVRQAAALARSLSAAMRVLAVVEPIRAQDVTYAPPRPAPRFDRDLLEEKVDRLLQSLPLEVGAQKQILGGDPADALVTAGRRAVDLMVVGSHADPPALRLFTGSVAEPLIQSAPWPVVVVPPQAKLAFAERRRLDKAESGSSAQWRRDDAGLRSYAAGRFST